MATEPTSSVRSAGPLVVVLGSAGMDREEIERRLEIEPGALGDPERRLPASSLSRIWDLAAETLGDPWLGLHLARGASRESYDVFSFIACASADLGEALDRIRRYVRLLTDAAHYELERTGDDAWWCYRIPGPATVQRRAEEFGLAVSCTYSRLWLEDGFRPSEVLFRHPAPADPTPLEEYFEAPVRFDAELCGFRFDAAYLETPLRTADPNLVALLERFAEEALAALPEPGRYAGRVRRLLVEALPDGDTSLAGFASAMALSERSLQRHLREEGTSHEQLLEEVRRELAIRYLADPNLTASEVAYLVGYSETGPFFRAFKRWTGRRPGEYRPARAQAAGATESTGSRS